MCGLNFIWDKQGQLPDSASLLAMQKALKHRGPDGQKEFIYLFEKQQILLGHTLLKIRDLSDDSQQPYSQDPQNYLLFNGEIYHCADFPPSDSKASDTAQLYDYLASHDFKNGEDFLKALKKLEGMYALIWLDCDKKEVYVARDPLGIKPLYYYEDDDYLIISSEIQALRASGLIDEKIEPKAPSQYLGFRHALAPQTFFKNIHEIQGLYSWDLTQKTKAQYAPSNISPRESFPSSEKLVLKQLNELLQASLAQHLQAEVPVGLFLSGGVDSSLLLALWREQSTQSIPVFSVAYPPEYQSFASLDQNYSRKAAQQYQADYHELRLGKEIFTNLDQWIAQMDQPIADPAALLSDYLSREAQKSVKVVLSGAGADEVFAGYNRHYAWKKYQQMGYFGQNLLRFTAPILQYLTYLGARLFPAKSWRHYAKLAKAFQKKEEEVFIHFTQLAGPTSLAFSKTMLPNLDPLAFALEFDQQHFLSQDVLKISDYYSMQSGIELRVPYLDAKLLQFMATLEPAFIFSKGKKWLLKAILNQRGGQIYGQRKKEGFGFPLAQWLRESPLIEYVQAALKKSSPVYAYLDWDEAQKMFREHQHQSQDHSQELWAVLVLHYWLEAHLA